MKSLEIKPPHRPRFNISYPNMFLAGSIEMGTAENWQQKMVEEFPDGINIMNPLRDFWDSSWEQDLNNPDFYEQVAWELDMLERADIIPMYFDPNTKSPITLLELGLHAKNSDYYGKSKIIVCCPKGYWRKGNVDIVCQRYGIPYFDNKETWMVEIRNRIELIKTQV